MKDEGLGIRKITNLKYSFYIFQFAFFNFQFAISYAILAVKAPASANWLIFMSRPVSGKGLAAGAK